MNRRSVLTAVPALAAIAAGAPLARAGAQDPKAPGLDPRLAAFPQVVVLLGEERIEAPASVPAGPTILIEETAGEEPGHAFVFRLPDDLSDDALAAGLSDATPAEETPEWFWRSTFVGNADRAGVDRPAIALVDLAPGRYVAGSAYRPASTFAVFAVSGNAEPLAEPEADVRARLFEMDFELPERIGAGRKLWRVENTGAMLHEIAVMPVPAGATPDDVETAVSAELEAEYGGDPAAARATIDGLGAEWQGWRGELGLVAGVGVLSPQRVSFAQFDLEPGTYGAVCYVPEPTTMTPHVMFGMTGVFTVEAPSV